MSASFLFKKLTKTFIDHSPAIVTGLNVAGLVSTVALAVRATPEAVRQIHDAQSEGFVLRKRDVVRLTWQEYIPAAVVGSVTIAGIIVVNSIHSKRQAAIMSLYSLTEKALNEYQSKVQETIGEKKEQSIREAVVEDQVRENPPSSDNIIISGAGNVLCYDTLSGRYFKSDMEIIRRAQNDINAQILRNMYASQNEFGKLIGLPNTPYGEEYGWNTDKMLEIDFSSHLAEDGVPCLCLDYRVTPVRGYWKAHG